MTEDRVDLFERLNIAVVATDPRTGHIRRANRAACALLGRSESNLVGLHWQEVTASGQDEIWRVGDRLPPMPELSLRWVGRLVRPDRGVVHVLATYALVRGEDGETELISQLQDISQEIAANSRLRLILDHSPVSLLLVDRDGIVHASEGLIDAMPPNPRHGPGVSAFALFAELPDAVDLLRTALAGQPAHGLVRAPGGVVDLHAMPVFEPDGAVGYVTCVATDVTRHQQALSALRVRSAEQSLIADLGQQALESLDATSIWPHTARMLADHLRADSVGIYELDEHGRRLSPLATATATATTTTTTATAAPDAGLEPSTMIGDDPLPGHRHSLTVVVGRGDRPLAVIEIDRRPDAPPFSAHDREFVRSSGSVLGAAAMRLRMEAEIRRRSLHDPLTGLPNRAALLDRLGRALHRAQTDGTSIGVLFIDLDGFKAVNDTLGHQAGDELLTLTAARLVQAVRPADVVGRLSGDEFAVLCERVGSTAELEAIGDRLLTALGRPCALHDRMVTVSASVGIALSGPGTVDGDDLLGAADLAMYTAKRLGPGRRLTFDESMRARRTTRIDEEDELRRALSANELTLRYEPIQGRDERVAGAVALPFWRHPRRGLLAPTDFRPDPERHGLRVPLDRWTIGRACRAAARWDATSRAAGPPVLLTAVSTRVLLEPEFLVELAELLATTGAPGRYRLCLEVCERQLVNDGVAVMAIHEGLARLGVALSIAEGGMTQAVVLSAARFPADYLRISRAFVDGIETSPVGRAALAAIIHFAHELDVGAMVADVMTPGQLAALRTLSCDLMAGPAVGPPAVRLPRLPAPTPPGPSG